MDITPGTRIELDIKVDDEEEDEEEEDDETGDSDEVTTARCRVTQRMSVKVKWRCSTCILAGEWSTVDSRQSLDGH